MHVFALGAVVVCSFSVLSFASPKNVTGTLPFGKCSEKTSFRRLRMQMALRKTHQPHPDMRCSISTRGSSWKLAENLFEKTVLWCQTFPGMFTYTRMVLSIVLSCWLLWWEYNHGFICCILGRIQPWFYQLYFGEKITMVLSAVFLVRITMVLSAVFWRRK